MKRKLILHFAQGEGDIPSFEFEDLKELLGFCLAEAGYEKVYLVSVFDEVFVSCHLASSLYFVEWTIKNYMPIIREDIKKFDIFYQEYESYQEAYKVALDMQEIKELCYEPKK